MVLGRVWSLQVPVLRRDEAADIRHNNEIDAVLTFEELNAWLKEEHISFAKAEPATFLNPSSKILRMYPIEEGILASLRSRATSAIGSSCRFPVPAPVSTFAGRWSARARPLLY